jgi:nucleoside-diphosphate-sugar epimerase
LPDGGTPKTLSLTNADDLTEALLMAIDTEKQSTIYNAVSTSRITIRELIGIAAKAYGKNPEIITVDNAQLGKLSVQPQQFPLVMTVDFVADDTLWKKDFPFVRKDLPETLLEMRDYNMAKGFAAPKVGLGVEKEQLAISGVEPA